MRKEKGESGKWKVERRREKEERRKGKGKFVQAENNLSHYGFHISLQHFAVEHPWRAKPDESNVYSFLLLSRKHANSTYSAHMILQQMYNFISYRKQKCTKQLFCFL